MKARKAGTAQSRPRLNDDDYRVLADFRRAIRGFLAFSAEGAEAHGLTSQQHQALLAMRAHQGEEAMTIGELAAELSIRNHSAIGLLARLEKGGYARRAESLIDRRRVLVTLTPAGATVLESVSLRNFGQLGRASAILEQLLRTTQGMETGPAGSD